MMQKPKYEVKTHNLRIHPQFKKKKRDLKAEGKANDEKEENQEKKEFTLDELQDKIKRQPSLYRNEFNERLIKFKALFLKYREDPSHEDETVIKYVKFMTHIADVYKKELEFLPSEFIDFLEQSYLVIHPNVRLEIVQALRMIRTK